MMVGAMGGKANWPQPYPYPYPYPYDTFMGGKLDYACDCNG